MIWYTEEFSLKDQPTESHIKLEGSYNEPHTKLPKILLRLSVDNGKPSDTIIFVNVFTQNPSMMTYEDPLPEDILRKYDYKATKICDKINKMTFQELLQWCDT